MADAEDDRIHETISTLIAEEHDLRQNGASAEHRERLAAIEVKLDQAWDLLRRRDAAREFGTSPDGLTERPAGEVEGYRQ